jgi:hypothetical protein
MLKVMMQDYHFEDDEVDKVEDDDGEEGDEKVIMLRKMRWRMIMLPKMRWEDDVLEDAGQGGGR